MPMKKMCFLITVFSLLLFCCPVFAAANCFVLGERVLCLNYEGVDVAILQRILVQLGLYRSVDVDGIYGLGTIAAVKELQRHYGLAEDGVVGPRTLAALPFDLQLESCLGQNKEDVLILARVIHGEARGESLKGQIGVGAVILNRVKHPAFPNTIRGVVLEDGQFSCIYDGQANYYPSKQSLDAAFAALMGYDPTKGALFFYNPAIATNVAWISKRPPATAIGNHQFLY